MVLLASALASAQVPSRPIHPNNVLVLIQPALAGPNINPLNYWQPQWVLWPPTLNENDGGQLLSVITGADWIGNLGDFQFEAIGRDSWRSKNFNRIVSRGTFELRKQTLGDVRTDLLVSSSGSASPNALRLALNANSDVIQSHHLDDSSWPNDSLMVTEASSWDEIAHLIPFTSGRVLVIEYPPRPGMPWTRYWLRGTGWRIGSSALQEKPDQATVPTPTGSPVAGLIPASLLIKLVQSPNLFQAVEVNNFNWPGANRFLDIGRADGLLLDGFLALLIGGLLVWGAIVVANERTSRVLPVMLIAAYLIPAIFCVSGSVGRKWGLNVWPIWLVLTTLLVSFLAFCFKVILLKRIPRAHPLLGPSLVGLLCLTVCDPIWSFMGPLMSPHPSPKFAIAFGALFGYLVCFVGSLRGTSVRCQWVGRASMVCLFLLGIFTRIWWTEDLTAGVFCFLMAFLLAEGRSLLTIAALIGLSIPGQAILILHGLNWAPNGLLTNGYSSQGLNLANFVDFLTSPAVWFALAISLWVAIFGFRFFFHQLKMLIRLDARRTAMPLATGSSLLFSLLHPSFLASVTVVATGAACVLLSDAVQAM